MSISGSDAGGDVRRIVVGEVRVGGRDLADTVGVPVGEDESDVAATDSAVSIDVPETRVAPIRQGCGKVGTINLEVMVAITRAVPVGAEDRVHVRLEFVELRLL